MRYNVFTRTWWRKATRPGFPGNLEPHAGPKQYKRRGVSLAEARQYCQEWNAANPPGRYSRKAEFEAA